MKILFVLEHFYPYIGGAEKLFYELSTNLTDQGYEIVVVTTQFDAALPLVEMHKGVKIVRIQCRNRYAFTWYSIPKVWHHAKDCDLIHTTTYNAALPAIIAGKLRGKRVFVTFHEVWGSLWRQLPFISWIARNTFYYFEKMLLLLPFDKFIAVSEFTKRKLKEAGIKEQKIIRIYNGIEYDRFARHTFTPPETFTYTFFGRLGISKGLDLLIPAAAKFREEYPDTKFRLIIPQEPADIFAQIKQLIVDYGLTSYVEIQHNLPRAALYTTLLNSSCVVIPSYSEGFCFAAAETVALGVPIISSDRGALREVVSGRYVSMNEQTVEALHEALGKAYRQEWTDEPLRYYHLRDSLEAYIKLYKG